MPVELSSFIGRKRERAAVKSLLEAHRMVTLTGVGGVGKTRLALRVADETAGQFVDGVIFVPLASVADPALVMATIAQACCVPEAGGGSLLELVQETLRNRHLLLILDNFEHLLAAAALIPQLLSSCPQLKVLATSRAALHITSEHLYSVPPLQLPEREPPRDLDRESECEAVQLFIERAGAANAGFAFNDDTAAAVVEICHRLDGLPLAIELAAARTGVLTPQAILARLGHALDLLVGGPRDQVSRHQTLRATIAWSYHLLEASERALFGQLAAFRGGWTLDAAEAVFIARDKNGPDTLTLLSSLVDQGLVLADHLSDGEPRFRLLETVREFAQERLTDSGLEQQVLQGHATYFLTLATELGTEERVWGPSGRACMDRLEQEHDNVRAALRWALDSTNLAMAAKLAGAMTHMWNVRGHYTEGSHWFRAVLALPEARPRTVTRAALLHGLARYAHYLGEVSAGHALQEECLAIARELGEPLPAANALYGLGFNANLRADYATARARYDEALSIYRDVGNRPRQAATLNNLTAAAMEEEDYAAALAFGTDALALARELHSIRLRGQTLKLLGYTAHGEGNETTAEHLFHEAVVATRGLGDHRNLAYALEGLGLVLAATCRQAEARALFAESLQIHRRTGERIGVIRCIEDLASVAAAHMPERAMEVAGAADTLRASLGIPYSPRQQKQLKAWLDGAWQELGSEVAERAWERGRALSIEEAVALAVQPDAPDGLQSHAARTDAARLTPREREVLRLLAQGHTNGEIADTLILSLRTVERHIANVYSKVGARGRADATVYALRHGLT